MGFCVLLGQRALDENNGGKHDDAADPFPYAQRFMEDKDTAHGAENRLHAH